jgi:hypothetical protein
MAIPEPLRDAAASGMKELSNMPENAGRRRTDRQRDGQTRSIKNEYSIFAWIISA